MDRTHTTLQGNTFDAKQMVHHVDAYPTLVTMLQGLIREAELAAIDLKPRRAVPLRAKARRARDLLHELGEVSE